MKKLLNEGPYITVKLTKEEKESLANSEALNPEGDDEFDTDCDWYLSNDPNLDALEDGRADFWARGEEYPYPYALLIGGNTVGYHYDSLSESCIEEEGLLHYFK